MPSSSNALATHEPRHALADGDDVAYNLVARYARVDGPEFTLLHADVRVADAAGEHLDEDLTFARRR